MLRREFNMEKPEELNETIEDLQNLNPQVATVTIGVRNLRKIKLYPLAVGDQMRMTTLVGSAISAFVTSKEAANEAAMIGFFLNLINNNLTKFLGLAICERPDENDKYPKSEELLCDITNVQASEIAKYIFEVNYETSVKNFKDLFEKVRGLFPSERSLPQSVKDTLTDLETSLEEPLSKEDLQEVK